MGSRHVEQNINSRGNTIRSNKLGSLTLPGSGSRGGRLWPEGVESLQIVLILQQFPAQRARGEGEVHRRGLLKGFGVSYIGHPDKWQRRFQTILTSISLPSHASGQVLPESYLHVTFMHFDSSEIICAGIFCPSI